MSTPAPAYAVPAGRPWRRLVAAIAACGAVLAAVAPAAVASNQRGTVPPAVSDVSMVQANIYTGLTVPRFQADVAEVLSTRPDFVTYNEVMYRNDAVMAPAGYDIYRDKRNRYTAETAVAWRSDRWTAIKHGTFAISNWRGVPPGRQVELGRRFANWVTLQGTDGRVLSVVSVHVAPVVRGMPNLLRPSVTRLGRLVAQLAPSGPVLVGGDFNVHYNSSQYPRDLLDAAGLVPSFDTLGAYFPTGDHHGATIDYVFDNDPDLLLADRQSPVELYSDHDAVMVGLSWTTDLPSDTQVVISNPAGDEASQRLAATTLLRAINAAQPGSTIALATIELDLFGVSRRLSAAAARGVHVRVVTTSRKLTVPERRLWRRLSAYGADGSRLRQCGAACRTSWSAAGVPRGFMMVSDTTGAWTQRFDANRRLSPVLVERRSRITIRSGEVALADGAAMWRSLR
jgi:endonuclease/exonuclease/phosphatase family metal-dependent hydrolase